MKEIVKKERDQGKKETISKVWEKELQTRRKTQDKEHAYVNTDKGTKKVKVRDREML